MVLVTFKCVPFNDLTVPELYAILRLRAEVFVVEQECIYQDLDGNDASAYHVLGFDQQRELVAYSRLMPMGTTNDSYPAIGRVIISKKVRRKGVGTTLMEKSIRECQRVFGGGDSTGIKISAQVHVNKFYASLGFAPVGEQYMEDGIPHVCMLRMP